MTRLGSFTCAACGGGTGGRLGFVVTFPVIVFFLVLVPPSPELVKRVRDLYQKRLPDVRFLIPVLNGLDKVRRCPTALLWTAGEDVVG